MLNPNILADSLDCRTGSTSANYSGMDASAELAPGVHLTSDQATAATLRKHDRNEIWRIAE